MAVTTTLIYPVPERVNATLKGVLKDENGVLIPLSDVLSITLTLYLFGSPSSTINNRVDSDIKNANGGTLDSSGNWSLDLGPLDNSISGSSNLLEKHVALIEWVYNSGAKIGRVEIVYPVQPMELVP